MDPRIEDAKGRIKEAAGALTGNENLKEEGKAEQTSAKASQALNDAADTVKGVVADLADKADQAVDKVRDALK